MSSKSILKAMAREKTLTEQLRQIILTCGKSRYRIWQESGVEQEILSRFVNKKNGFTLETLDRLGKVLHLRLVQSRKPKRRRKA